ncbi:MAG: PD-(D/E)XK nuclease family protein [Archangium sp.]|nr:PD-(D/E)XK nuclease family protein [Archangium sp.]
MSRKLLVVPDADRVEQWLLDESRRAEFVDLRDTWTVSELLERLEPGAWAKRAPADPLLVQMLFGKLAGQHAANAFGPSAHTAEFASQARELVGQLRGQAATPRLLEEAAASFDEGFSPAAPAAMMTSLAERARALASLWRAVDESLARAGLVDRGDWLSLAAARVNEWGLPAALEVFDAIEIRHVHDVPPARLALFEALARAASSAGIGFAWRYPASGSVACDAFIVEAVRAAEAKWQAVEVELAPDVPEGPLSWLAQSVFGEDAPAGDASELTAFCAPTVRDEVREIARRVRRLVSAGVPPEAICVAWRDLAEDTEQIVEALAEVGVPTRARLGVPLTQSPNGRLALSLLELADEGFPSDGVATLLESRAVKVLHAEAADPRAAFREAGVRDDVIGASGGKGAYAIRLAAVATRAGEASRRFELLAEAVQHVIDLCRRIPEQGPATELLEAWWDAVSRLGLLEDAVAPAPLLSSELMLAELDRALAREQAAVESLASLLSSLKDALGNSGLGSAFMTRREFTRWVRAAAAELNLAARGPRAGAVWLLDVRELAGRSFAQLFLGGLIDGRFPGRSAPMPLLSEEERLRLNAAARMKGQGEGGKSLFRVSVGEGDVRLPLRLAEDRLLFHLAVSSAASVTISRSRFDDSGRELLPSPFHQGLRRVLPGFIEERIVRGAIPPIDEVQTESELRVRLALEALSPVVTRQSVPDPRAAALASVVSEEGWFERARDASAMESERLRFFSDPSLASGAFSGRVSDGVLDALQPRLAYDATHPVAAHELGEWGTCAFRGLSTMVVGLRGGEAAGEELDSRSRGDFWHDVLKDVVAELDKQGTLGKDAPGTRALIEKTVQTSARKTEHKASTGHPALWGIAKEWAVTVIHRLVTAPEVTPFGLARPKFFEVAFGSERAPEKLREVKIPASRKGERDVHLYGRIDRVDVGSGMAGVIDYKTSVKRNVSRDFLVREFQMAFYLLAVRSLVPDAQVNGAWHAVGRNQLMPLARAVGGLSMSELLATDELTRARLEKEGGWNLANSVFGLVDRLRGGDFGARPVDCEYCELKPVCRISDRRLPEEKR